MLLSIAIGIVLIVSWLCTGLFVLKKLKINGFSPLAAMCLSFSLGFGILGNIYMALGMLQLYKIWILWAVPVLGIGITYGCYKELLSVSGETIKKLWIEIKANKTWAVVAGLFLLVYFVRGLLPPTGIDALMYHLPVPQLYLGHGGFYNLFHNPQANLIMLTEMNYVPILATGNATGCAFTSFAVGLCLTAAIVLVCRKYFPLSSVFACTTLFLSLTNTIANFSSCNADFTMAMFAVMSFYVMSCTTSRNRTIIMILLLGFCTQSKIFGFFSVLCISATCIILNKQTRKSSLFVLLLALMFGLPWLLKSGYYSVDFVSSSIQVTGLSALAEPSKQQSVLGHWFNLAIDFIRRVIIAPWSFSLLPDRHRIDTIGPLFLILLPGLFIIKEKKRALPFILFIAFYIVLISIFEVFTFQGGCSIRYSTPALALLCPLAIYTWKEGLAKIKTANVITSFLVWITILLNLVICFKRYRNDLFSILTLKSQHEHLMKNLAEYPAINYANTHLSMCDTVMTSTCFGTYYLKIPYYCAYKSYNDMTEMIDDFKKMGIRYFLANDILDTAVNAGAWEPEYSELVFEKNSIRLFRFKPPKE